VGNLETLIKPHDRTTNNSIIASFWTAVETFSSSHLLAEVRQEAEACRIVDPEAGPDQPPQFDIEKLLQQPVLQAIYAETLRLRISDYFVRHHSHGDIQMDGWRIPNNHLILTSPMHAHMDASIWGTERPVDEFWPERFLKPAAGDGREFTTERAKGAWVPYGGGYHACPGRHFAKMMIIFSTALLVTMYDCEILANPKDLAMTMRNFWLWHVGVLGQGARTAAAAGAFVTARLVLSFIYSLLVCIVAIKQFS
jgi:cytochrome P450